MCGHGRGYDRGVVNVGARGGVSDKVKQSDWGMRVPACVVSLMCAATGEGTIEVW